MSIEEPKTTSLWLRPPYRKIWYYGSKGWEPLFDIDTKTVIDVAEDHGTDPSNDPIEVVFSEDFAHNKDYEILLNLYTGNRLLDSDSNSLVTEKGLKKLLPSWAYNPLHFTIGNNTDNLSTLNYISSLPDYQESTFGCYITGEMGSLNINDYVPSVYYNGEISSLINGKLYLFNVDFNSGEITTRKVTDLTLLPTYVDLEIGNTDTVKQYNLEQLMKVTGTQFFVHADYGIGVGSFNTGAGGEATINTSAGNRVHYIINSDGSCAKDEDHYDHSDLFYDLGSINISDLNENGDTGIVEEITDSIKIQAFKKASNIALTIVTSGGNFEVNCPQTTVGPNRKEFNSPTIDAGQLSSWTYFKVTASIEASKITLVIETF